MNFTQLALFSYLCLRVAREWKDLFSYGYGESLGICNDSVTTLVLNF